MNAEDHDRQLDEMLLRSYEPLRLPDVEQRQAILARLAHGPVDGAAPRRRMSRVRIAWSAAAAGIAVVVAVKSLLIPSSADFVYGIDSIPRRLLEVRTIRLRGWEWIYNDAKPGSTPVRVPLEYSIKRPGKFRHRTLGVGKDGDKVQIRQGLIACDGQHISSLNESDKQFATRPIGSLDAWLKTENLAQMFILSAMLGSPDTRFKKIGQEKSNGRWLDLYEARSDEDESEDVTITTLWFDPSNGYPLRLRHDSVLEDGSRRRDMEYDDITVNIPLDDELFCLTCPEGFQTREVAVEDSTEPKALDSKPTSAGYGPDAKLEMWHALRIAHRAVLLVWRRSAPKTQPDGARDWLAGLDMKLERLPAETPFRHTFLYQSDSPEIWNWSLVVIDRGQLPDPCMVTLELREEHSHHTMGMISLRFAENELEQLVDAASRSTLPEGAPQFSLAEIRSRASALSASKAD